MKVGEYCRTDKGEIGKLKDLKLDYTTGKRLVTYYTYKEVKENLVMFDNTKITQRFVDGSYIYLTDDELKNVEESIVKSSPNIIDLIEENDLIEIEYKISTGENQKEIVQVIKNVNNELFIKTYTEHYVFIEDIEKTIYKIKGIITHEQINSMEYKVKE